jgi:hypothetical protein
VRLREYSGPLAILTAGVLGFSLLCSVSAMAMSDLENYIPATMVPLDLLDLAVSNLRTAAALTEQAVTQFVPTETLVPTRTPTLTPAPSDTATLRPTFTHPPPTRTRREGPTATPRAPLPTNTPQPTNTPVPTITPSRTPTPVPTSTPIPTDTPTDTPVPPTDTPVPPTETPVPPTETEPPPTDTAVAESTDVPIVIGAGETQIP